MTLESSSSAAAATKAKAKSFYAMLFEKIRSYRPMMAFHSLNFYGVDHKLNEPDMKALRTRFLYLDESSIQRDYMPYVENTLHVN